LFVDGASVATATIKDFLGGHGTPVDGEKCVNAFATITEEQRFVFRCGGFL